MFLVVSNRPSFVQHWRRLLHPPPGTTELTQARASVADAAVTAEKIRLTLVIVDGAQIDKRALQADSELARLARRARLILAESNLGPDTELLALALGVAGCCQADLSEPELRRIVDVVLKGGIWISRSALPDLLGHLRRAAGPADPASAGDQLEQLTPREREIALCVAEGATNKLIAKRLSVTDVTVKAHLTTIFQKLGVSSRVQLALLLSSRQSPPSAPHPLA